MHKILNGAMSYATLKVPGTLHQSSEHCKCFCHSEECRRRTVFHFYTVLYNYDYDFALDENMTPNRHLCIQYLSITTIIYICHFLTFMKKTPPLLYVRRSVEHEISLSSMSVVSFLSYCPKQVQATGLTITTA